MLTHIAVDIGGTKLRAASYPYDTTEPTKVTRVQTQHADRTLLERVVEIITSVWPENEQVAGIAIAAPGPLNPFEGVILSAPNIPEWVNFPLRQIIQDHFQVPVLVGNDANLAALGEWKFGAGQGHHHLIYLTVSTGIGSGIIIDDKLLLGEIGIAAELGHVTVLRDGPQCSCGKFGHLEAIASGTAIAKWVEKEIAQGASSVLSINTQITARKIAEAANAGDSLSIKALMRAGTFLGQAIADYVHIFNPTIVIIGGGVSRSGNLLFIPIEQALQNAIFDPHYLDNLKIVPAALGDDAGLLGALALIRADRPSVISKLV